MSRRAIPILSLLLAVFLTGGSAILAWAQQGGSSGARNIFDQGVGQRSDSSTKAQQRSELPERAKPRVEEHTKSSRPHSKSPLVKQSRTSKNTGPSALKYSVVLLGQENPKEYAGV